MGTRIWGADMDRPCDAGRTYLDARHQQQRQRLQQYDLFAAVNSRADAAWQCMWWCRHPGPFVCCSSSAGTLWGSLGPAINRLDSAPRSGMGSGEQSAAVEGTEDARRAMGIDTKQRPPLPARRADPQRLTVLALSGSKHHRQASKERFDLCARSLHPSSACTSRRLPGLSAARRNTRGSNSVNQGLAPNSRKLISHASPEAIVPFSTRAPSLLFVAVIVLHTFSLVLFLSLALFILDRLHRLRWPSPLPRLRFLLQRVVPPRSPFRLASLLVSDQRHGPPSHNGFPRRHIHIRIPLLANAARRRVGVC